MVRLGCTTSSVPGRARPRPERLVGVGCWRHRGRYWPQCPEGVYRDVAAALAEVTGKPYITASNKFAALGSLDPMVRAHAGLRGLAVALMKIANDMRWLASGPRCGLGELILSANEPGSSIMPGKVNPTQCEALVMIAIQVIGDDTAVALAGSQGNFELNAMRPVIINNVLHSARILGDGCAKFLEYSVKGTSLNNDRIAGYVDNSGHARDRAQPGDRLPERRAHRRSRNRRQRHPAGGRIGLRQSHRRTVRLNRQAHQHDRRRTCRRITFQTPVAGTKAHLHPHPLETSQCQPLPSTSSQHSKPAG